MDHNTSRFVFQMASLPKPVYRALKELAGLLDCTQRGAICVGILVAAELAASGQLDALKARLQKVREMDT